MPHLEKSGLYGIFDVLGISYVVTAASAHRNAEDLDAYVKQMIETGANVLICGVGMSGALPGAVAAAIKFSRPVIGVPLPSTGFENCMDSMLSIFRMPPGVPVMMVDNLKNAALAACQILSLCDSKVGEKIEAWFAANIKPANFNFIVDGKENIAEGKTKIIWKPLNNPEMVDIESKDDITAGDGAKRDVIENKGEFATRTTVNCFKLLEDAGIHTHFIKRTDDRTFRARYMSMIPIELVARRIATGSYLKRNPDAVEGQIFEELVLEMFFKDDARHDPIMEPLGNEFHLHEAGKPVTSETRIDNISVTSILKSTTHVDELFRLCKETFLVLESAWKKQDVALVDLKIECGYDPKTGKILIADVIDNDSWRIWPAGEKSEEMSKQVYRDSEDRSPDELGKIKKNYEWVAERTDAFLE